MKYLYSSLKYAFFILITFGIGSIQKGIAQDFTIDKTMGAKGQSLKVTISSSDVVFQQATASNCPSSLKVNASGVKFTLNSGNTFSPSSIQVTSGSIVATLNIPSTISTGDYTVSVTGAEGSCTVTSTTKFTVKNGYVTLSPQFEYTEHIVSLTIAGFGINFEQGSPSTCPSLLKITDTTVVLKQGSTIIFPNFINSSSDTLTGDFSIPASAPLGDYDLIIDYQGPCPFVSTAAFSVHPRSATITPATGKYGTTATVTISGNGLTFDDTFPSYCPDLLHVSATNVYFKQGSTILYPDDLSTNASGQIVLHVTIPENQAGGDYDVYIADDQTCSIIQTNGFTIETPTITSISPSQSLQGTTFTMDLNASSVTFDQVAATLCPGKLNVSLTNIYLKQGTTFIYPNTINSAGQELVQAEFSIPSNAPYGKYDVVVGDGEGCTLTLASGFTVPAPGITSVSPLKANPGQTLDITINTNGVNLLTTPPSVCPANLLVKANNISLTFGSTTIHPTSISITGNKIVATVTIPQNADIGSYDVIVGDGESCPITASGAFSVTSPTITVSPNSAYVNANLMVTITGVSLNFTQSTSTVCPNLLRVTNADVTFVQGVNIIHPSSVLVTGNVIKAYMNLPSYTVPGYYDVVIAQNSSCPVTLTKGFYVASPSATLSPATASQNETVDITITGVDVNFSETSATACPSLVNVNPSNIVFTQGSTTLSPASITVTSTDIVAHMIVPSNFPTGYTTLTIGLGESCPVVVTNALKIQKPTISTSVNYIDVGANQEIIITGHGITFIENGTTTCPSTVNINTNDISLVYGSTTIHPGSATLVNGTIDAIFNTSSAPAAKYTLVVGDQSSCLYTALMNVGVLGITNAAGKEDIVEIFPNPSDGSQLFMKFKKPGNYSISILDVYGKEIGSFNESGSEVINIQENIPTKLPTGIYHLKVSTENQLDVTKLIIE